MRIQGISGLMHTHYGPGALVPLASASESHAFRFLTVVFCKYTSGLGLCHLCTYSVRIWAAKSKAILWAASERTYTLVQQSPWEVNVSKRVMVL